jgi:energy-converting hydrogenase Eha subunit G
MKSTALKIAGWSLIVAGASVAVFSQQIVFPGLERWLGIETIVGRANVRYLSDGGYVFTNPEAMMRWIAAVATIGILFACGGALMLLRTARLHRQVQAERRALRVANS